MNRHTPTRARSGPLARSGVRVAVAASRLALVAASLTLAPAPAIAEAAAGDPTPSPSEYGVSTLCATPAPGYSGCLGLRLFAREPLAHPGARAVAPATSVDGRSELAPATEGVPPSAAVEQKTPVEGSLTPANVRSAYALDGVTPASTQTIALVDAYDSATIAADLEVFSSRFGLPACNEANGCFRKVNQNGAPGPLPASSGREERGWAQEIATDVELAHGICPSCSILLVEAKTNANSNLYAAEQTAVALGANEVSNSWGGEEPSVDSAAFDHSGVVITASAGDEGYLDWLTGEPSEAAEYPANSPHVVAVGGTRLKLNATSKAWEGETVWNDGALRGGVPEGHGAAGGGCSGHFAAASWQQDVTGFASVGCGSDRAVADVAADADPYTGVAVYDSTEYEGSRGWATIGGTSVSSPVVASVFALAGGAHGVAYPASTLYENDASGAAALHDVTAGSNGECRKRVNEETGEAKCTAEEEARSCAGQAICLARSGYDGPSGVGSPNGIGAFQLASEQTSQPSASPGESTAAAPSPSGSSAPGSSSGAATSTPGAGSPAAAPRRMPALSALKLTRGASAAIRKARARLSRIGFSFTLNVPARLRVSIAKRVRARGRLLWRTIGRATIVVHGGVQTRSMSVRSKLARGRYRLTLAPDGGTARSLLFTVA